MNQRLLTSSLLMTTLSLSLSLQAADWQPLKSSSAKVAMPKSLDENISIELVTADPEIVTPVSCRFDGKGRLLVVESHTHFPPNGYKGLKHDRVRMLRDSNGDGRLDQIATFYEGMQKTMGLAIDSAGWVYLATRAAVIRVRDTDGDDVADQTQPLLTLETKGDYPHNGLSGLLLDEDTGTLLVGMGENLGFDYTLVDQDGNKLHGGNEGGNIFQCTLTGTKLKWIATGFWNPFGLCRDTAGRVLMVGNDADARPPCRISEVVPMGDYGYQFRFGRSGTHPLQAWNGELPGTLPMVVGTGEAPCAILDFRGRYWVTSWGDNRIERYTAKPKGASIVADQDIAITGGPNFRPVDMAVAPDGSLYVTDWVNRSYNVHSTGHIWRIRFKEKAIAKTPPLSKTELGARSVTHVVTKDLIEHLKADDPFGRQWAMVELAGRPEFTAKWIDTFQDGRVRLAWLLIHRWNDVIHRQEDVSQREKLIRAALKDTDESVRLAGVRWAAERRVQSLQPEIAELLQKPDVSPRMLAAVAAALSYLETGRVKRVRRSYFDELTARRLVTLAMNSQSSDELRIAALQLVPPEVDQWNAQMIHALIKNSTGKVQREAVRHLAVAAKQKAVMKHLAEDLLKANALPEQTALDLRSTLEPAKPAKADPSLPAPTDTAAWMKRIDNGGDADAGWRVFFGATANCSACHRYNGRGATVGPDLTGVSGKMDRKRFLQSILEPSREIAPMYVPFTIVTTKGIQHQGLKLQGGGNTNTFLGSNGKEFSLSLQEIEMQQPSRISIMPADLHKQLTTHQLRDLLAFLSQNTTKP